ncbi:hypothetical protein D9M69_511580 [compost metagenome]
MAQKASDIESPLLDKHEARTYVGKYSVAKFDELVAKGVLPKPIQLGETRSNGKPTMLRWVKSELTDWINAQIAAARNTETTAV